MSTEFERLTVELEAALSETKEQRRAYRDYLISFKAQGLGAFWAGYMVSALITSARSHGYTFVLAFTLGAWVDVMWLVWWL